MGTLMHNVASGPGCSKLMTSLVNVSLKFNLKNDKIFC